MPRPAHRDYTGSMPLRPRYTRAYGRHRPVCGGRCLLAHLEPGEQRRRAPPASCSSRRSAGSCSSRRGDGARRAHDDRLSLLVGAGRRARALPARGAGTQPAFSRLNRGSADPDAGGLLVASLAFLLLAMFTEVRAGSRAASAPRPNLRRPRFRARRSRRARAAGHRAAATSCRASTWTTRTTPTPTRATATTTRAAAAGGRRRAAAPITTSPSSTASASSSVRATLPSSSSSS